MLGHKCGTSVYPVTVFDISAEWEGRTVAQLFLSLFPEEQFSNFRVLVNKKEVPPVFPLKRGDTISISYLANLSAYML